MIPSEPLLPHLFRTEYRKIVAVLCKSFGFDQMEVAEDIASETFLTATQSWGVEGVPPHPTAWLYTVARNKAKNYLQRADTFRKKVLPELSNEESPREDLDLSPEGINDAQLQMMFAICHPSISAEAQVGLALRILCGFGIGEIADAFFSNKEAVNKRLFRARERLREEKIRIGLPGPSEIEARLSPVLTTVYLLFNEGYYSVSQNRTLRKDLCLEAMRLCTMLVENQATNLPQVNALLALMCFHASRFDARIDPQGDLIPYDDQDTCLWNTDLISKGGYFLHCASTGVRVSKYHLEAGIAYWNTRREDTKEKWEKMLQLYNRLLQLDYSPIAALNRTYVLSKVNGKPAAIAEAEHLGLTENPLYYALLGELYTDVDHNLARAHLQTAVDLARTNPERRILQRKIDKL